MRKSVTLYNVIFPVWFLILIPITWILVLPANFLIDSLVLLLIFHVLKLSERKTLYKKTIFKVWGFGFLADIIGAFVLFSLDSILGIEGSSASKWLYDNITGPLGYNPFKSVYAIVVMLLIIAGAGALIYVFNYKVSFKRWPVEDIQRKKAALMMAIITAPYTMLIPASWLTRQSW